MKTRILTILLIAVIATGAQAQSVSKKMALKIIEEMDAVISRSSENESHHHIIAEIDSFYDEELVKMKVRSVVREYSDVSYLRTWSRDEAGDISCVLKIGEDKLLMLTYKKSHNVMFLIWPK